MGRQFLKRDETGKITGATKWPHPDFPEETDDQDAEYFAFLDEIGKPPSGPRPLDAEELYDILEAKGILAPQDRPRSKPARP